MGLRRALSLFAFVAFVLLSGQSIAHEARPLYVEVAEQSDGAFVVQWRVPPVVTAQNLPTITLPTCSPAGPARLANGPRGVVGAQSLHCPDGIGGAMLEIVYPQHNPAISTLLRLSWASGEIQSVLSSPEEGLITLPDQETTSGIARDYTMLGIGHILAGYDHLLFIACLVLIAGSARRVFFAITGFTLAHSVTLALAALGLVQVPVAAVEAAIALSILFLAVEIVKGRRDTLAWRYPISVAIAFGLLHGFGFASVLTEIGLPQTEVPAALLYFNVGVEIGQISFVVMLIVILTTMRWVGLLARSRDGIASVPVRIRMPAAYFAGSLASFWMISRIAEF